MPTTPRTLIVLRVVAPEVMRDVHYENDTATLIQMLLGKHLRKIMLRRATTTLTAAKDISQ